MSQQVSNPIDGFQQNSRINEQANINNLRTVNNERNQSNPDINDEWAELIEVQRNIAGNERSFCCFGCTSPEILLVILTIFWVVMAFYEGLRDYNVKHYEAIVVYVFAFCMFAAMVSSQTRFFAVALTICILEILWNLIIFFFLIRIYFESLNSKQAGLIEDFTSKLNLSFYIFLKRMINEDFYGFVFVHILKIAFIISIIITGFQVRQVQLYEIELHRRHRRIEILLSHQRALVGSERSNPIGYSYNIQNPVQHFAENTEDLENLVPLQRSVSCVTAISGNDNSQSSSKSNLLVVENNINYTLPSSSQI